MVDARELHRPSWKEWIMSFLRSSRLKSTQKSPTAHSEQSQPRRRSQRGRSRSKETDAGERNLIDLCDLIDLDTDHDAEQRAQREAVGTLSYGLDGSTDRSDSESSNSSLVSGPSNLCYDKSSYELCSACQELYEKAGRLKMPMKSKLLDNDPKSLSCDQWVLVKKRKPRRRPGGSWKLLSQVQLDDGAAAWRRQTSPACSRPHTFLQRNLRRAVALAETKKNQKKRRRGRANSQGSCVAKQRRLHDNHPSQRTNTEALVKRPNACFGGGIGGRPDTESQAEDEAVEPAAALAKVQKRAPKKACRFSDLLAKMRANSSVIIRETSRPDHQGVRR